MDIAPAHNALFRSFIGQIMPLSDDEWNDFIAPWQYFQCGRKSILTVPGEHEKYVYFVIDGVQRAYYLGENEREATIVFTYAPSFSGVADSVLTGLPSRYYFETITSSSFLRLRVDALNELIARHRNIQYLIMRATSLTLYGVLARQAEIQTFSSEEKFKTLLQRSPHLLKLVPHKYIASYLGIDPTNFSKLLGSIKI